MKRFILSEFPTYYPSGGGEDITGSFDTKKEAFEKGKAGWDIYSKFNIFDQLKCKVVLKGFTLNSKLEAEELEDC